MTQSMTQKCDKETCVFDFKDRDKTFDENIVRIG